MKTARSLLLSAVVALSVFAASIQQAQAVLPVLVYSLARQAVFMTAETVAIQVLAKGFAANDPYVRTTATIPRSKLSANLAKMRGPRWVGMLALLATVAAYGWDYDEQVGLYVPIKSLPAGGLCVTSPDILSPADCFAQGLKKNPYVQSAAQSEPMQVDCSNLPGACPKKVMQVNYCPYSPNNWFQCLREAIAMYRYIEAPKEVYKQPVTEKDINEKLLPAIVASPNTIGDMFAGATQQQLQTLLDGATIPYSPTNPTPEMEQLKNDYRQGILQTIDPSAAHYVTPDLLKQIQDLVAAEDAAKTDDGTVDGLNEKMKQPITQAQYEESNKKFGDAVNSVTDSLPDSETSYSDIDDSFTKLDGIITDLPNTNLPAPADISVPQYVDCQHLTLSDGNGHDLVFPSSAQCAKIETFKQGFGYFLAISVVFLLCMQLLTRPHG